MILQTEPASATISMYVDLAKAHVCAMTRVLDKETEPIEYFNIGTGNGNSTLEIVETFEKATGVKLNWKYGPRREGDMGRSGATAPRLTRYSAGRQRLIWLTFWLQHGSGSRNSVKTVSCKHDKIILTS